jgi:ABC-type dipeptide/oligopeptide/nickel transport system permease subunit
VIYGARPSLAIGLLSATGLAVVAIVFGLLAGYYGGVLDTTISRLTDVFLGFPFLVAAIVILTSFHHRTVWTITMVIILFAWPAWTRVMRSGVLGVVNLEYVAAARALGASDLRILVRHILPNAIAPLVVLATLGVGSLIVAESSLTYLGVGLQLPAISWGLQLSTAQTYFSTHPHLLIFPALFLSVTVLSFVLAGDAVREALDPRQL